MGYKCNKLYEITFKKRFLWEPEKKKIQISQELRKHTQVKSSCVRFYFVFLKLLKFDYSGSNKNIFFAVISYNLLHCTALEKC